jgi:acetyltransferase-like isoleucine patch superfamily enzyme
MTKLKAFFFIQNILLYFPFTLGIYLRRLLYPPFFKKFGKNVTIYNSVLIKYPNEIELEDNVTINHFCYIVGKGGLKIGANSMIGAGSKIVTTNHIAKSVDIPMRDQGISFEPIELGEDVWLGFNVVITSGSRIGKGCIIGANSVVSGKEYKANSVIAGVPSKLIGNRQ